MFGRKKDQSTENTVALSQDEVDKLLKGIKPQPPVKKTTSKETEEKIRRLKERTKAVEEKMKKADKAKKATAKKTPAKKTAAKKTPVKKTAAKKTVVKKAAPKKAPVKKTVSKKPVTKYTVYYDGKAYGTAAIITKNGKKVIELLSIKKKK